MERNKNRAPYNRTLTLTEEEIARYSKKLLKLKRPAAIEEIINKTINQNLFHILDYLPPQSVDLIFIDPPYNMNKAFNTTKFDEMTTEGYFQWLESWFPALLKTLKPDGSLYLCGDWRSSTALHLLLEKYLIVQNRITWEREKGRGAKLNFKNCSEDIWFCTASKKYTFNVDAIKLKRKVLAPYKDEEGSPKDWTQEDNSNQFRLTSPSNLWTDITVPFWSMPENTDHPTQKPEKLLAKIILASSNEGDIVLDPFMGSGTTSVTAKKLKRNYVGIDAEKLYCCLAEKRLFIAESDKSIQGYECGVFWERNSIKFNTVPSKNTLKSLNNNK
jgi:site-specific DNA-methyltransferase (adenine-specific)